MVGGKKLCCRASILCDAQAFDHIHADQTWTMPVCVLNKMSAGRRVPSASFRRRSSPCTLYK